jgi:hypothetical protein
MNKFSDMEVIELFLMVVGFTFFLICFGGIF